VLLAILLSTLLAAVVWAVVLGLQLLVAAPALADSPLPVDATPPVASGAELFGNHCVGCHINGGNIIRRSKNLRLAALERNGIDGPGRIAAIAAAGQGQMGGYGAVLGEGGPEAVAAYVWEQAQLDWPRG
jgi:cytochrome c6